MEQWMDRPLERTTDRHRDVWKHLKNASWIKEDEDEDEDEGKDSLLTSKEFCQIHGHGNYGLMEGTTDGQVEIIEMPERI